MHLKTRHFQWTELVIDSELPSLSKYLCLYLATFMNAKQDFAWPALKRIEHETGLTTPTILKYLNIAEQSGFMMIEHGDRKTSNRYYAKMPVEVLNVIKYTPDVVLKDVKQGTKTHSTKVLKDVKCNKQENNQVNKQLKQVKHLKPKGFEEFWVAYPKKKNKQQAIKAFKAQRINGELQTILDDIQELKNTNDWMREGGQFIPYPSSYLNGRRWEDERDKTTGEPF